MKNTIVEEFQKKCKNCDHVRENHYSPVLDCPPFKNDKKEEGSACRQNNCNCKKFE